MKTKETGTMKKLLLAAALPAVLLFSLQALAHEGHAHRIMGVVTYKDAEHLEMDTTDGDQVSILVTPETKYLRGGKPARADDVKVGQRIVATTVEKEGKRLAREIRLAPVPQTRPR